MNKKICDNCKKEIKGGRVNISLYEIKDIFFKTLDVCEKCFDSIPQLTKNLKNKKK
mgnify:CR=1 FL=1